MSLVIDFDSDDLPDGFPDTWGRLVESVRTWGIVASGYGGDRALGVSRRLAPEETDGRRREQTRAASERFYERAKADPDWVEKRRAYYRQRYIEGKDRSRR